MPAVAAEKESFEALLNESLGASDGLEGSVIKGLVIALENDFVVVDAGLKKKIVEHQRSAREPWQWRR